MHRQQLVQVQQVRIAKLPCYQSGASGVEVWTCSTSAHIFSSSQQPGKVCSNPAAYTTVQQHFSYCACSILKPKTCQWWESNRLGLALAKSHFLSERGRLSIPWLCRRYTVLLFKCDSDGCACHNALEVTSWKGTCTGTTVINSNRWTCKCSQSNVIVQ